MFVVHAACLICFGKHATAHKYAVYRSRCKATATWVEEQELVHRQAALTSSLHSHAISLLGGCQHFVKCPFKLEEHAGADQLQDIEMCPSMLRIQPQGLDNTHACSSAHASGPQPWQPRQVRVGMQAAARLTHSAAPGNCMTQHGQRTNTMTPGNCQLGSTWRGVRMLARVATQAMALLSLLLVPNCLP